MISNTGWRLAVPVALVMLAACGKESEPPQSATPAPAAPQTQPAPVSEAAPALPPESSTAQYAQAGLPDTLIKDGF